MADSFQIPWQQLNDLLSYTDGIESSLSSIDNKLPTLSSGRMPVVLPAGGSGLTDTELRASAVPVSGTITADTELPVAAALGDTDGNPTTPLIGAANMGWSGASWNRMFNYAPGDTDSNDRGLLTNARGQVWNGSSWSRLPGDTTGLTIKGTVTANLSATDNAVLDAIEADTTAIQGALETVGGLVVNLGTNNDVTITSGSVTETSGAAIAASLSVMDDWDNTASDGASVSGDVAHDSPDAGEPVKIGAKAFSPDGTTPGTAVAENDRTNLKTDLDGRLFVTTVAPTRGHKHLDGSAAYTDESLVADPGDGFQIIITSIIASTGAATALNFFLEEGASKIFGPIYLEATAGRGFVSGPIHLPITASTAVTLTSSAAIAQSFDMDYFIQAV